MCRVLANGSQETGDTPWRRPQHTHRAVGREAINPDEFRSRCQSDGSGTLFGEEPEIWGTGDKTKAAEKKHTFILQATDVLPEPVHHTGAATEETN